MQNNTNAPKEWGIKVGSQVRCFKLVNGTKQDGNLWGFFSYVEKEKDTKKPLQKYNLWLTNDYNFMANFPTDSTVDLRIERIDSVKPIWSSYTSKDGKQVNERVINMEVVVSIVNVINNNNNNNQYNNNNNYNNNGYNQGYQQPNQYQQPTYNQGYQQQPNQYQNNPNSFDVDKKTNYNEPLPKSNEVKEAENFLNIDISEDDLPF